MSLPQRIRDSLTLPVVCPPMFLVSGPELVREACLNGLMAGLPRQNARTLVEFAQWLDEIMPPLNAARAAGRRVGPVAANLSAKFDVDELDLHLALLERHGIDIVISATGNPAELTKRVHDWGGLVFHDVTSIRFAEKAIDAGVDGLVCIGAGGGGHSGTISAMALIPKVRSMFDGTVIAAGAIGTGAAARAAEILGADLAYMGTRFIATEESRAPGEYKKMLLDAGSTSLRYVAAEGGVPANWLRPSLVQLGVDPDGLGGAPLPADLKYWKDVWSAGQAVELITDIPPVATLIGRLRAEYLRACELPDMAGAARLAEQAWDARG